MKPNMSPQEIEQRKAQVADLSMQLADAAAGADHAVLLDALLYLYVVVAETNSCCTQTASLACVSAASRLQKTSIYRREGAILH